RRFRCCQDGGLRLRLIRPTGQWVTIHPNPHQIAANHPAFATRGASPYTFTHPPQGPGMDRIRIVGGKPLNGTIPISGAKNAALPLMIAALLTEDTLILDNVPRLADVAQLQRILGNHGVDIMSAGKRPGDHEYQGQTLHISAANIIDTTAPYELVSKMRASFWVIAPLLARMHEARVSLPGGCAIGTRPV